MKTHDLHGILLKLASCFCGSIMIAIVRHLSDELNSYQLTFFRTSIALLFFMPWIVKSWPKAIQTQNWPIQIFRTILSVAGMSLSFVCIAYIPLPTVTSIGFTAPIFSAIFAIIILKERNDKATWVALFIGFLGMLIIVRPGTEAFSVYMLMMIVAVMCWAGTTICVKFLTQSDSSGTISSLMMLLSVPLTAPMAFIHWQEVPEHTYPWLLGLGASAALAQYLFVRAYALTNVTNLTPMGFSRLVFVSIIAYIAFAEIPSIWTLAGAAVIIASVLYNSYHVIKKG